jgi:hypothetical protein
VVNIVTRKLAKVEQCQMTESVKDTKLGPTAQPK